MTSGSVFEVKVITCWTTDFLLASSAPGAFILLGVILALKNHFARRAAVKAGKLYVPPAGLDCHSCQICQLKNNEEK
jgi:electron transport complex protein RnfE